MTVAELRKALEGAPDDMEVVVDYKAYLKTRDIKVATDERHFYFGTEQQSGLDKCLVIG